MLELLDGTKGAGQSQEAMLDGMEERIGVSRLRRGAEEAELGPERGELGSEPSDDVISRIEAQRARERLEGGPKGGMLEKSKQESPEQGGIEGVARQNGGEENREGKTTASPIPTIGAEDALTSADGLVFGLRVVAVENAVAIERLSHTAARASLQLQGKRAVASSTLSETKRKL